MEFILSKETVMYFMVIGSEYLCLLGEKWTLRVARCETTLLQKRSSIWSYATLFHTTKDVTWS